MLKALSLDSGAIWGGSGNFKKPFRGIRSHEAQIKPVTQVLGSLSAFRLPGD